MSRRRRHRLSERVCLTVLLVLAERTAGQKSSASCASGWDWADSKNGDSPCTVAAKLLSLCDPSGFTLQAGGFYTPSTSHGAAIQPNTCACNLVTYNLLSGCQSCQQSGATALSWSSYAAACTTCSSTTGISPGPCGPLSAIGFPNSVTPGNFNIEVPNWAYYNSSGGTWSESAAQGAAGGDHTTISPAAPSSTSSSSSPPPSSGGTKPPISSSNTPASKSSKAASLSTHERGAVIACSLLAALIFVIFVTYLLRLCHRKRQQARLKTFSDAAFDKIQPAQKSPRKTTFKRLMSRLSLAIPKTPGLGPGTPKTPKTPKAALMRHFPIKSVPLQDSKCDGFLAASNVTSLPTLSFDGAADSLRMLSLSSSLPR